MLCFNVPAGASSFKPGAVEVNIDRFTRRVTEVPLDIRTTAGAMPDDGEHLEVMYVPVAQALDWVRDGRITEAKAITGLLWADKILRGDWK